MSHRNKGNIHNLKTNIMKKQTWLEKFDAEQEAKNKFNGISALVFGAICILPLFYSIFKLFI